MKILPGIVVALLQFLCPLAIASCFLVWFPHLLESVFLKALSYGLGVFFLAGAGLVLLGWAVRKRTGGSAPKETQDV
jgi:hypothetical protein